MGHNSVASDHPKSTGIPRVDELLTGPPDLGRHNLHIEHHPSTHMIATLDSSLDFSLFDDVHWSFALILVVE